MKKKLIVLLYCISLISCKAKDIKIDDLVLIKGGSFKMGIKDGVDNPTHDVELTSFYISKYEITVDEWRQYVSEEYKEFDYFDSDSMLMVINRGKGYILPGDLPMYYITWEEATKYCNWLSKKRKLIPVYSYIKDENDMNNVKMDSDANGYRLPTEAEWEYAAKGGMESNGFKFSGSNFLNDIAWSRENSQRDLHPVGKKQPNELGLYDMNGNVSEYTWDFYDDTYYEVSPRYNPLGANKAYSPEVFSQLKEYFGIEEHKLYYLRTSRGGNILTAKDKYNLNAKRFPSFPNDRGFNGFRLARSSD